MIKGFQLIPTQLSVGVLRKRAKGVLDASGRLFRRHPMDATYECHRLAMDAHRYASYEINLATDSKQTRDWCHSLIVQAEGCLAELEAKLYIKRPGQGEAP